MMKRLLSKLIFKLNGWKIIGPHVYPEKCLVIAAPHTSNWDFLLAGVMLILLELSQNT